MFELQTAADTGIDFSNRIVENDSINILKFDYVYNGAGVGVADFDHDGLQDLFFSANQQGNKLYLNKGDLKFQDITETAQVNAAKKWNSGVALVDINSDGWMDIYVAATSTNNSAAEERENSLYVNQGLKNGVPVFKEMAKEYGVNDNGHSENAVFFDYDNDGDLDLYILTNKIDQYPNLFRKKLVNGENPNTDRLYRNDWSEEAGHAVYTNVSLEAGISIEGFGLGINITDINRDGWQDIYVCNDYVTNDLMYINNQNGTFTESSKSYLKHSGYSSMGNDIADINNDGLADIVTVDMVPRDNQRKKMFSPPLNTQFYDFSDTYGFLYQYGRNMLQLNNGAGEPYSEIGLLADIAETDWSWSPTLADFNNDGYRDLFVTNGFPKDVTDKDFMAYRSKVERMLPMESILPEIPQVKISNYAFMNNADLGFMDVTDEWGLKIPSFSNGAVYADLDNDGDLDYVVNNINDSAFVYKNNLRDLKPEESNYIRFTFKGEGKNNNALGAKIYATYENGESYYYENSPYRGYKSTVELVAHVGLGKSTILKNVVVVWPNSKAQKLGDLGANKEIELSISNATESYTEPIKETQNFFTDVSIDFLHKEKIYQDENNQTLSPFRLSQMGPGLSVGDIDNDGLSDLYIGGPLFKMGTLLKQHSEGFSAFEGMAKIDSVNKTYEETGSLFFDADLDGDLDLYIVTGGSEVMKKNSGFADLLYLNDGHGKYTLAPDAIPSIENAGSCVRAGDFDKDGDLDLFIAGRNTPLEYPKYADSYILENVSTKGKVQFKLNSGASEVFKGVGLICDALCTDFDNDGDIDLILVGDFMAPTIYENQDGKFTKKENTDLEKYLGLWSSIQGADFDLDGDIDYVVGNMGKNALFQGTQEYPAKIYSADFDNNGLYDVIPFVYFRDQQNNRNLVPYAAREDVHKQLNITRSRFTTYSDFVAATDENVFSEEEKKIAKVDELNWMASSYIENLGNGKFKVTELPLLAQVSSIRGLLIEDFDKDGYPDVLVAGNNFSNELIAGQYDASNGILLINNQKGGFVSQKQTGFIVTGDAKAMVSLPNTQGNLMYIVSQNKGPLRAFNSSLKATVIPAGKNVVTYTINGKESRREFYSIGGYLSQSSRYFYLPEKATNVSWQ